MNGGAPDSAMINMIAQTVTGVLTFDGLLVPAFNVLDKSQAVSTITLDGCENVEAQ